MRLSANRRKFLSIVGERPRGWDDLWSAFAAAVREPVEEPDMLYDNLMVEIAPAYPPWSQLDGAVMSRRIGIRGKNSYNDLEAAFIVSALWAPTAITGIAEVQGRGPSSYDGDPAHSVEEFIASVEKLPAVAVFRASDAVFQNWDTAYQGASERD